MADSAPGAARDRFRLVGPIGAGSLTEVRLCRLLGVQGFEKEVAVKRLAPEHVRDPLFAGVFVGEARTAAKLFHPNIVQVFEVGEDEGGPYIAMEYVRGVSAAMISAKARELGKIHHGHAARIVADVCDALAYAHSASDQEVNPFGVVHGDLNAQNIIVTREGIPKVLDFGMASAKRWLRYAKPHDETVRLSRPPRPEGFDPLVDVFATGAVLFELTTGMSPVAAEGRTEELLQRLRRAHRKPSQLVAGYPPELERIVLSAMELDVGKRCPSAAELRDQLHDFAASAPYRSTPRALVTWLGELFPHLAPTGPVSAGKWTSQREPVGAFPQAELAYPEPRGAPSLRGLRPPMRWPWAVAGAIVIGAGIAVGTQWRTSQSPPAPSIVPAPRQPIEDVPIPPRPPREVPVDVEREPPPRAEEPSAAPTQSRHRPHVSSHRSVAARAPEPLPREAAPPPVEARPPEPAATRIEPAPSPSRAEPPPPAPALEAPARPAVAVEPPSAPSLPERPPPQEARPPSGPTVSATPRSPVPIPTLPRVYVSQNEEQIAHLCRAVETAAAGLAGVSPEFARGITGPMRRSLRRSTPIYPIGMYYFIVREAGLKHDSATAAANLAAAQSNGVILRFKDLAGIEGNP